MAQISADLSEVKIEGGDGITVIRGNGMPSTWNGIQYKAGLSRKTVGSKHLSMSVASVPPGGTAAAHIHVGFEVMLYVLHGRVRHTYGPGLTKMTDNEAGDFIFVEPGTPHAVFNLSETEPVVVVVARSDPDEQQNIVMYERDGTSGSI